MRLFSQIFSPTAHMQCSQVRVAQTSNPVFSLLHGQDFDSCGGLLTESSGTFHSVNFPKFNYPNSMTCVWLIRAPENHQIVLTFSKMTLEISTNCKYDSVTVLSGWSRRSHTK